MRVTHPALFICSQKSASSLDSYLIRQRGERKQLKEYFKVGTLRILLLILSGQNRLGPSNSCSETAQLSARREVTQPYSNTAS